MRKVTYERSKAYIEIADYSEGRQIGENLSILGYTWQAAFYYQGPCCLIVDKVHTSDDCKNIFEAIANVDLTNAEFFTYTDD